ncbi:MAG TPA: hypothetical protein DEF45_11470 [Rhodopirellula sp.]|nr:hypothetical protein [Rhodopirellula sp.]
MHKFNAWKIAKPAIKRVRPPPSIPDDRQNRFIFSSQIMLCRRCCRPVSEKFWPNGAIVLICGVQIYLSFDGDSETKMLANLIRVVGASGGDFVVHF